MKISQAARGILVYASFNYMYAAASCQCFRTRELSRALMRNVVVLKMVDLVSTSEDIKEAISESLKYFPDVRDLKPEQRLIVEHAIRRKDVFAALRTGFGKSLTFQNF